MVIALPFLQQWAINWAITFAVRQISKYGKDIDWKLVEQDAAVRARDFLPGTWFDDEGAAFVVAAIEGARFAMAQTVALERIGKLAAEGRWDQAISEIKSLILGMWVPTSPAAKKTFAIMDAEWSAVAA